MIIGSSSCLGDERSKRYTQTHLNTLDFLLGLLGYARSDDPLRERKLSARSNGLLE